MLSVGLSLTKIAEPEVVLLDPGDDPPAEEVTYTFVATNTGTAPLTHPEGGSTTDPAGSRTTCASTRRAARSTSAATTVTVSSNPASPGRSPAPGEVSEPTTNTGTLTGQPTDEEGEPLDVDPVTDEASAFVDVLQPALAIDKTALVPAVLDPDAPAVDGPDTPDPRQAEYRYEVSNPGNVPLSLDPAVPEDDKCESLTFVAGDNNGDTLLDPDEVWEYTCSQTLEREDANEPPGDQSALVENRVEAVGVPVFDGTTFPDKEVTASDTAEVIVIQPGLELTKTRLGRRGAQRQRCRVHGDGGEHR